MVRWTLILTLGALFAWPAFAEEAKAGGDEAELPGVGAEAPTFTLPVYNSEAAKAFRTGTMLLVGEEAEDTATKVIVVSFMASHCKPCKKELPFLQQLHEKHHAAGLRIVGVSIDNEPEGIAQMGTILKDLKITFPVVKDQYNFTARRFLGNKVPLPSVFVLNRAGIITFVSRGYNEEISKNLVAAIEKDLGPAKPAAAAEAKP